VTPTESKQCSGRALQTRLLEPIDVAWLVALRILLGVLLAVSMQRFLAYGWVDEFLVRPAFHFKYWGFVWVEPLGSSAMQALFYALLVLSLAVAVGAFFRVTAPLLALGLTYVQLIDVSTYLNHYYLAALLMWLLAASPAHQAWSVDAWRNGRNVTTAPSGWQWLFRVQVGVVYFFAGLGKLQLDWLQDAQPLRIWLGQSTSLPLVGPLLTIEGLPLVLSWCGFLFDTTIVGWLSWKRTRPYAYFVLFVFHLFTRLLFDIGMFPFIMSAAALVFFSPSWPRALVGRWLEPETREAPRAAGLLGRSALWLGAIYCAVQLVLPLRHFAYGGNVLWHEQGMRFSWRVMVRAKGGSTTFLVRDPQTGIEQEVSTRGYLTPLQQNEMAGQPDLILQMAHAIGADLAQRRGHTVEVRAETRVSLNGRRAVPLIDPVVDLTQIRDGFGPYSWVLPAPTQAAPHTRPVL